MNKKFIITGTGRCGSSLLAAILAHSGANFGMKKISDWNRGSGAFEHPTANKAYYNYKRGIALRNSNFPELIFTKFFLQKAKKNILKLYKTADYAKNPHAWIIAPHMNKWFNGDIRLIGVYRRFSNTALSYCKKNGTSFKELRDLWLNVNNTMMLYMNFIDNSVLISYEELVDENETNWAKKLSKTTGINEKILLKNRNKMVDFEVAKKDPHPMFEDKVTQELYEKLRSF